MARREVGRRVVRTRVLGSANPVARWGRESKSTCWDSIGGFFFGLLLFGIAFIPPFYAARTEKISRQLERLPVVEASEAGAVNGLSLLQGTLDASATLNPPRSTVGDAIAYRHTAADLETRYETHTETRTEVRNGQDVEVTEEVTEEVTDWVGKIDSKEFASGWKIGVVAIDPRKTRLDVNWENSYAFDDGKHRERVDVLKRGARLLLAAELVNGEISPSSKICHLTTKSKEELVAALHSGEEGSRWGLIILSVVLWTAALNLIAGPAMIMINIIPISQIGAGLRGAITLVSFLIACLLAWMSYVIVKYWWLVALVLAGLTVWVIMSSSARAKAASEESEEQLGDSAI